VSARSADSGSAGPVGGPGLVSLADAAELRSVAREIRSLIEDAAGGDGGGWLVDSATGASPCGVVTESGEFVGAMTSPATARYCVAVHPPFLAVVAAVLELAADNEEAHAQLAAAGGDQIGESGPGDEVHAALLIARAFRREPANPEPVQAPTAAAEGQPGEVAGGASAGGES
jgi:hypothetical protein